MSTIIKTRQQRRTLKICSTPENRLENQRKYYIEHKEAIKAKMKEHYSLLSQERRERNNTMRRERVALLKAQKQQ